MRKTVKAWALVADTIPQELDGRFDIFATKEQLLQEYSFVRKGGIYRAIPCTITYTLPKGKKRCRKR